MKDAHKKIISFIMRWRMLVLSIVVLALLIILIILIHSDDSNLDPRSIYKGNGKNYFKEQYIQDNQTKTLEELDNPVLKAPVCLDKLNDGVYDELSKYFEKINNLLDNDIDTLYTNMDKKSLESRGYFYPEETFVSYITKIKTSVCKNGGKQHMFLTDCADMGNYYICTVTIIAQINGAKNNVLYDYDNCIKQEFTIYVDTSNKATFLPFNILDINICADVFGLIRS